jgi:uncharacterized membrane protein
MEYVLAAVTLEGFLHLVHIVSVIIWVGGVITLNVLAVRVGRGPDRSVQAELLRLSDVYGRIVIAPAGVLTLISGILLVNEYDMSFATFWVAWGLIGLFASVILGATLIRATQADLRRMTEHPTGDDALRLSRLRRAAILYAVNVLILLSIVWAMVFKPTI